MKLLLLSIALFCCQQGSAQEQSLPNPGESFPTYFARMTRSGSFNGIYLKAPESFQYSFLSFMKESHWVGAANKEISRLQHLGVNYWSDWMTDRQPQKLLLNSPDQKRIAKNSYELWTQTATSPCRTDCPSFESLFQKEWDHQEVQTRALFIEFFVSEVPLFAGKRLVDILASNFSLPADRIKQNTDIKILNHSDFIRAVREMGWQGEVSFRGITGPDPKNANRHWICLDDDYLQKYSNFESPLFRMLEIIAILTHEMSHVAQDLRGSDIGSQVTVVSAETQLIIEGMAEYLAEKSLLDAGDSLPGIQPWTLFSYQQAIEIESKWDGGSAGIYFPYKVGLPFLSTLYSKHKNGKVGSLALTDRLLQFLNYDPDQPPHSTQKLEELLLELFPLQMDDPMAN